MKEILGQAKSVRQLMSGEKYSIDFYQREYKWQVKQVQELITDLTAQFQDDYQQEHPRREVRNYGRYFLGSIIISDKDGQKFLIDGQQRMTTLTLLLIYLYNQLKRTAGAPNLSDLIYAEQFGEKSFNLDVPERTPVMASLFEGDSLDEADLDESQRNLVGRYKDIEALFPQGLQGQVLPYFADWLIENVYLVQITAHRDEDAYTIFETMNDRGLSLTPTDMLKGYLLANVTDTTRRVAVASIWKERLSALTDYGKEEDSDALKAWLRGQYAETIRERKPGATAGDFDRIGTEFHRWIREKEAVLGLTGSDGFANFIEKKVRYYMRWYLRLRNAADHYSSEFPAIYFNARNRFTLQYPLILATLSPEEDEQTAVRKARVVSTFADILIYRRHWNFKAVDYSTMQYAMFLVIKEIRGKSLSDIVALLKQRVSQEPGFNRHPGDSYYLHGQNRSVIHQMLARMTDYLEQASGLPGHYLEYSVVSGQKGFEVEHIWANKFTEHTAEFANEYDFQRVRNQIGGLLLLPKQFNASYGAKPYKDKLDHYNGQNLLARSLHPLCYTHNPGFLSFARDSGLPFKSHPVFDKADNTDRCDLYQKLAERVWSLERLDKAAQS